MRRPQLPSMEGSDFGKHLANVAVCVPVLHITLHRFTVVLTIGCLDTVFWGYERREGFRNVPLTNCEGAGFLSDLELSWSTAIADELL